MLGIAAVLLAASMPARAATPAEARVGSLDYVEGKAFVDGAAVNGTQATYPIVGTGQVLSTDKGHAEMLLTPGVYLRLDNNSEVRLLNASLTDTQVRLDEGAAMLEVDNLHKENLIRMQAGAGAVTVLKQGLYRFAADPASVRVLDGKVQAVVDDVSVKAGKHREVSLVSHPTVSKFSPTNNDELSRWSRLRSEYQAEASMSSAQYLASTGLAWGYASWYWNPWFSTWTWFPASGWYMNPYGYGLYSPWVVYRYVPQRYYHGRSYVPGAVVRPPASAFVARPRMGTGTFGRPANRGASGMSRSHSMGRGFSGGHR